MITCTVPQTWIKTQPISSESLLNSEKLLAEQGQTLNCEKIAPDINQHYWVKLTENGRQGYIYGPHWQLPKPKEVKLPVRYASQMDNWGRYHGPGSRQCNLTCHSMTGDYLLNGDITKKAKAKGYLEAEDLYGEVLYKYGDTTNPQAHTPALRDFGIESYFTYTGSIKDLVLCLDKGVPVPIGVAYKSSGHYVCAVGHRADGVYIHDPFGTRLGTSDQYDPTPGIYDFCTWDWLKSKWVDQGSEAGWMRVCTAVKGKATGVPAGL